MEKLYSTREVAKILNVTVGAVASWRLQGKIKPLKAGHLCRYPESEINRFLGLGGECAALPVSAGPLSTKPTDEGIHPPNS